MLALQRRPAPPQKIKSLFGTVLTTQHVDIASLSISAGSSSSHLCGVRGTDPRHKRCPPCSPHPSQKRLIKLTAKAGHTESPCSSPCTTAMLHRCTTCPRASVRMCCMALGSPGTGHRWCRTPMAQHEAGSTGQPSEHCSFTQVHPSPLPTAKGRL